MKSMKRGENSHEHIERKNQLEKKKTEN